MTYFYFSEKQAVYYRQANLLKGLRCLDESGIFYKMNYVLNGDELISFTDQCDIPPEGRNTGKGWGDYRLVFQSSNPKIIYSQELW